MTNESRLTLGVALAAAIAASVTTAAVVDGDETVIIERDAKPANAVEFGDAVGGGPGPHPVVQPTRLRSPHEVDTAAYHTAVQAAKAAHPDRLLVDFLSPPVEPGASVSTGGNFPRGARLWSKDRPILTEVPSGRLISAGTVELTGASIGSFRIDRVNCRDSEGSDATWCEVTATNTSSSTLRLTAMVEYEVE